MLFNHNMGRLLGTYTKDPTGKIVKAQLHDYVTSSEPKAFANVYGADLAGNQDGSASEIRPIKKTTIQLGANIAPPPEYAAATSYSTLVSEDGNPDRFGCDRRFKDCKDKRMKAQAALRKKSIERFESAKATTASVGGTPDSFIWEVANGCAVGLCFDEFARPKTVRKYSVISQ